MSITLIGPGKRKGNKYWVARVGAKGRRVEISTNTTNKANARRFAEGVERRLYGERRSPALGEAIDGYLAFRRPGARDAKRLEALRRVLGGTPITEIGQAEFDDAAAVLLPHASNATRKRGVYTPFMAVLRHAGERPQVRRTRVPRPSYRALTRQQRDTLINAATGELRHLLIVLFYTGARIGEALTLTWDRVDFEGEAVCFRLAKTGRDHWRPLHPKAIEALRALDRNGKVFSWTVTPWKRIRKLRKDTGIPFTPHVARHTFADLMMEGGASLRDLMDAGGWLDHQSAMRYTAKRVGRVGEVLRKALK